MLFFFLCFFLGIELKFFRFTEIAERIFRLENSDTQFHEIPSISGSRGGDNIENEKLGKPQAKTYEHDRMSSQLLLKGVCDSPYYRSTLSALDSYYYPIEVGNMSFYDAVLVSLWWVLRDTPGAQEYTSIDFKNQILMHILDLYEYDRERFNVKMISPLHELEQRQKSLYAWVKRFMSANDWGCPLEIFPVLSDMWSITLRVHYLDECDKKMVTFPEGIMRADAEMLYNSQSHFTATLRQGVEGLKFSPSFSSRSHILAANFRF